jgi:hypothetical protein
LPPSPDLVSHPISPELALVDRDLGERLRAAATEELVATDSEAAVAEADAHEAMLRMCELSDVNPPSRGGPLALAITVPAALWAEALILVASLVPLGSL